MQESVPAGTKPVTSEVCVGIPKQKASLIKDQTCVPHRRTAAKKRQDHFGNHGFASTESDGYQPYLADLVWPLVTEFLGRELIGPAL